VPLESTGPILGVFEDSTYKCAVNQLEPGDKVLLFTDGIIESPSDSSDESSDGNQISAMKTWLKFSKAAKMNLFQLPLINNESRKRFLGQ